MYGMNRYIGCGGDDSRGCVGRGEVCDVCQDFLPVGKNPPPPSLLGDFGREFGVCAPGFDGAAGSAKLRKNADRATLLHITIAGRVPTRSGHPLMLPVMPALGLSKPEGQPHQNS
jgi:hypothetical protein